MTKNEGPRGLRGLRQTVDVDSAECRITPLRRLGLGFVWLATLMPLSFFITLYLMKWFPQWVPADAPTDRTLVLIVGSILLGLTLLLGLYLATLFLPKSASRIEASTKGVCFDGGTLIPWSEVRSVRERGVRVATDDEDSRSLLRPAWKILFGAFGGLTLEYSAEDRGPFVRRIPLYAPRYEWIRIFILKHCPKQTELDRNRTLPGNY